MNEHPLDKPIQELDNLTEMLEDLHAELSKYQWINVKDQMPPDEETVLIYYRMHKKDGENYHWNIATAYFDQSNYLYDCWQGWVQPPDGEIHYNILIPLRFVTHWMTLPSPPNIK